MKEAAFVILLFLRFASEVNSNSASSCLVQERQVIQTDVVVVGAGYAGLTTARRLSQMNFTVHVLEASNATGGRTKNFCLQKGKPDIESDYVVELGGQWLGNKTVQPHSWQLIVEELGFDIFDSSYTPPPMMSSLHDYSVLYASNGVHNFTTLIEAFHKLPMDVQAELKHAWEELDHLSSEINLTSPYSFPEARVWDSQTFTTWINNTVKLQESRTALDVLCTTMIAQSPDVVSFLHILFYIRAAGGMENLVVNEQQYRVVGGTQAPTFKMAQELGPGHVLLSTPVHKITQVEASNGCAVGSVVVEADDGMVIVEARYAVVTGAPPTSGRGIRFIPPLPFEKSQLFQRMPMGNSVKAQIVYPSPFWRDEGYTGTILASIPPFGQDGNPLLSNCFDNTPHAGSPGVILCFIEGETATQMMRQNHNERLRVVAAWLSKTIGPKAADPSLIVNFLDYNWAAQPFIGGAYSSFLSPGVWTQLGHTLREPFGQIYWAGSEYAEDGFGYINGAIQSAEHTADEIAKSAKVCK